MLFSIVHCPPAPDIDNTIKQPLTVATINSTIMYACEEGYGKFDGENTLKCANIDGRLWWVGKRLYCTKQFSKGNLYFVNSSNYGQLYWHWIRRIKFGVVGLFYDRVTPSFEAYNSLTKFSLQWYIFVCFRSCSGSRSRERSSCINNTGSCYICTATEKEKIQAKCPHVYWV